MYQGFSGFNFHYYMVGVSVFLKRHDISEQHLSAPQEAERTNSVSLSTFALPLRGDKAE
jgi:hypothetical protein